MERRAGLSILVLTLRKSATDVELMLDRYEDGERERTVPSAIARAFRTVEHDARTMGLEKLAKFAEAAKEVGGLSLEAWDARTTPGLLRRVAQEMRTVAARLETGERHELDRTLLASLQGAIPKRF